MILLPFEQSSAGAARAPKPVKFVASRALRHDPLRNGRLRARPNRHADTVRAALGVPPAMKVCIFDAAEAAAWEADWRDLAARSLEPNVFFQPGFALAAAQHLSEAGEPSFIFIFARAETGMDRLVGVFPFTHSRLDFGVPMLRGWRHAYNPSGTPLLDAELADAALNAFFDHMEATSCHVLRLGLLRENGPTLGALKRVVSARSRQLSISGRHVRAVLQTGTTPEAFFETHWRAKKLKELRRLRRKLEETGPVVFRTARTSTQAAEALEHFLSLEASGWKGRAGTAMLQDAGRATFVRSMLRDLSLTGAIRIDGLYRGGTMVAGAISLISGGTVAFWKIAYDESLARFSPGVLLTQALTQAFLADPNVDLVDSCAVQDHPMIDHFWPDRIAMVDCILSMAKEPGIGFTLATAREAVRSRTRAAAKTGLQTVKRLLSA